MMKPDNNATGVMPTPDAGEVTPLLASGSNGTNPNVPQHGPRRRTTAGTTRPQHYQGRTAIDDSLYGGKGNNAHGGRPYGSNSSCCFCCPSASTCRRLCFPIKRDNDEEEFYQDSYNDQPWECSFGTREQDGIWMNRKDQPGTIMSFMVWLLIVYSGVTVTLLSQHHNLPTALAMVYCTICALALASHAKTTYTDPGAVPQSAVPIDLPQNVATTHALCSQCQSFKPPVSHHCRICGRCISRMDHHCPWMNNCIGAANLKHFILFLIYTWTGAGFALLIFGWNYFLCADESCQFSTVLVQLVRAMTVICIATLLFTSSMLMNVTYGIMTGIGTIDRLRKKAHGNLSVAEEEPIPLEEIFGIGPLVTWPLPIDPIFEDYDHVMGYSTPQRLLREQASAAQEQHQAQEKGNMNNNHGGYMDKI